MKDKQYIKTESQEKIRQWGIEKVPQLEKLKKKTKSYLSLPAEKQQIVKLEELAEACSYIAGLLLSISKVYMKGQKELDTDDLRALINYINQERDSILNFRNHCLYNIGLSHKEKGNTMEANIYFLDALESGPWQIYGEKGPFFKQKAGEEISKLLGMDKKYHRIKLS